MTPEKQRIAIAEFCGWKQTYQESPDLWDDNVYPTKMPDYINDLNEMLKAVERLPNYKRDDYLDRLISTVVQRPIRMATVTWLMVTAKSEQHAEALLKTIGKWEN